MLLFGLGDAFKIFFFLFRWQWYRYLLHTPNTSHYRLDPGTHDRRIITVIAVLSRHSGSAYSGLDQIITLLTSKQLFSSSLFYEPMYTIDTYMLSRVRCTTHMNAQRHDPPRLSYTYDIRTWATRGGLYGLTIYRIIYKNTHICQGWALLYSIYIIMFSVGELWATDEPARDLSDVCAQNYDTGRNQWVALPSICHWLVKGLKAFNPTMDKLPDCAVHFFSTK